MAREGAIPTKSLPLRCKSRRAPRCGSLDLRRQQRLRRASPSSKPQECLVSLGGVLAPLADAFLNGIAPHAVFETLHDKGILVHKRHILPGELEGFEQCCLTGTQPR